jgi:hypothetical protein
MSQSERTTPKDEDAYFKSSVLPGICDQLMKGAKEFGARMLLFTAFGLVQGFRHGFRSNDYLFILCGSAISFCGIVGVLRISGKLVSGENPTNPIYGLFISVLLGQLVPYIFFLYTLLYRGFYYLVLLFNSFHWARLLSCIFFIYCSLTALKGLLAIQEANKTLRKRFKKAVD